MSVMQEAYTFMISSDEMMNMIICTYTHTHTQHTTHTHTHSQFVE